VDQLAGNPVVNVFYKDDVQTALEYLHQCFAEPDTVHHCEYHRDPEAGGCGVLCGQGCWAQPDP